MTRKSFFPRWAVPSLILMAVAACTQVSRADVLYLSNGEVVFGRIVRETADSIEFRERVGATGEYRQRAVPRAALRAAVRTIDEQRLGALRHGQWSAWRDLAEELAVQQVDPEARELARHLFLIVARHAEDELREAGFRGAIALSDNGLRQQIRALAFQATEGDSSWLTNDGEQPAAVDEDRQRELSAVLAALRDARRGDRLALQRLGAVPATEVVLKPFATICSWDQFRRLASGADSGLAELALAIRLEVAVAQYLSGRTPEPLTWDSPWSVLAIQSRELTKLPNFSSIVDIDLEATEWRDGQWQRPGPPDAPR